jgi:putative addiction module antidote
MTALKLRKIGNSVGLVFPKEELARLRAGAGDIVHITEAPGGVRITNYDPAFERQMAVARKIMKQNRDALRELAK